MRKEEKKAIIEHNATIVKSSCVGTCGLVEELLAKSIGAWER